MSPAPLYLSLMDCLIHLQLPGLFAWLTKLFAVVPFFLTIPNMVFFTLSPKLRVSSESGECYTEYRLVIDNRGLDRFQLQHHFKSNSISVESWQQLNRSTNDCRFLFNFLSHQPAALFPEPVAVQRAAQTGPLPGAHHLHRLPSPCNVPGWDEEIQKQPFLYNQAAENAAKLRGGREGKNAKNNSTEKTTKLLIVIVVLFLLAEFPMVGKEICFTQKHLALCIFW